MLYGLQNGGSRQFLSTTRGKVIVIGGILGLFGIGAFYAFTTTDVGTIKPGQCFADWDDFAGRGSRTVADSPKNADCDDPHAVQAYWVAEPENGFECSSRFESDVVVPPGSDLDWLAIEVERFGTTEKIICLVGHSDEQTLITGSVVPGAD